MGAFADQSATSGRWLRAVGVVEKDAGEMMNEDEVRLVEQVEACVAQRLNAQRAGHGMDHVLRVLRLARMIQAEVGGEQLIVELAALLHDVGDAKFHDTAERSGELSREILCELNASCKVIEHVEQIVDNISFRKAVDSAELSLEGKIVQDADRLDALGAIGIVRMVEYGAAFGQPFHLPGNQSVGQKTGVAHFHEKLFKLRGLLNTEPAKRMALQREQFMKVFLEQFLHEWSDR